MIELRGMPVVHALTEKFSGDISALKEKGIIPQITVVRVGEREDDIAYERGILKRFSTANALVNVVVLPSDVTQTVLESTIENLNQDPVVHGILLFRPLPKHLSEVPLKSLIAQEKDVDCLGTASIAHVFEGDHNGFPPCTPQAVMEILHFYNIDLKGKKVAVIGRSLVVGKPLSMLLLGENATVTICHSKTTNLADECRKADILIACVGVPKMVNMDYVHSEQVIIDVGINIVDGKLYGDVDYEIVADKVKAITPVPGGVGTVTTSVLLKHTILNAMR